MKMMKLLNVISREKGLEYWNISKNVIDMLQNPGSNYPTFQSDLLSFLNKIEKH